MTVSSNKFLSFVFLLVSFSFCFGSPGMGAEPTAPKEESVSISGKNLAYLIVAAKAMEENPDVPAEKKKLEDYGITLKFGTEVVYATFHAPWSKASLGKGVKGGETDLGRDVRFMIDKATLKVINKKYFK